jgi:hypothetical protein
MSEPADRCRLQVLFLFYRNSVLADAEFDAVRFTLFIDDVGSKSDDDDGQSADDEIKSVAAIHDFPSRF